MAAITSQSSPRPVARLNSTFSDEITRFAVQATTKLTRMERELGGQISNFVPVLLCFKEMNTHQRGPSVVVSLKIPKAG